MHAVPSFTRSYRILIISEQRTTAPTRHSARVVIAFLDQLNVEERSNLLKKIKTDAIRLSHPLTSSRFVHWVYVNSCTNVSMYAFTF